VAAATSKHAITFASAVTSCSPILLTSGPISIAKNLTITGPGASAVAVSGDGLVGVFSVSSGVTDATISGLTIENGNAGSGGNGLNENASIPGNNDTADVDAGGNGGDGGGIYNTGGLTLTDDIVSGNTTGSGGIGGDGTISISGASDTVVIGDGGSGGDGGGIYNTGSLTLTNDTVSGNTTGSGGNGGDDDVTATGATDTLEIGSGNGGDGGGIYNTGSLTLTNDTVSGNTTGSGGNGGNDNVTASGNNNTLDIGSADGGDGGGIYNTGTGSLTLTSDTVSGNTTGSGGNPGSNDVTVTGVGDIFNLSDGIGGSGGGIYNDGTATISADTVSGNGAGAGGGISFDGSALTLTDTIVANSPSGGNCAFAGGSLIDGGYNLDSGTTCGLTGPNDKTNVSPQLGPLQENGGPTATMALASTSPTVDAIPLGSNGCGTTLTTDQRGALRPNASDCDMGAYEYGDLAMQTLAAKRNPVPKSSNLTYTATVSNAGATDATGVTVTDTLPKGEKFKSATASQGSCSTSSSTVTCTLGQVGAAVTPTITIVVKVTAKKGKTLSDTATVSATTGDTIPSNDSKTVNVVVS
jgi:uncharacterized repeat protein (TIGR01451 family)